MKAHASSPEANIGLLRRAFAAFNRSDLDACIKLIAPDFIINIPGLPAPATGHVAWRQNAQDMRTAFPDLEATIEDVFGAGDRVAVRLSFRGTHKGPFHGIPPTGQPVAFTSVEIYRIADGVFAEEWVSPDGLSLMLQVGAVTTTPGFQS
jgi:steroid delta-isomerase-like uncharacterized protein